MNKTYLLRVMKLIILMLTGALIQLSAATYSQTITLKGKNIPLQEVVSAIMQQTDYIVISNAQWLEQANPVSLDVKAMPLQDFMKLVLKNQPLAWRVEDKTISLYRKPAVQSEKPTDKPAESKQQPLIIGGQVIQSETGEQLEGVTVLLKGTTIKTTTNAVGKYKISIPNNIQHPVLVFSFVGMKGTEVAYAGQKSLDISLDPNVESIKDVVITGIYQRKKESFAGSSATYTAKELKMIGNQGILQSLKTLDPSFAIVENNQFGSDPNRLPDIEVRGKSSVIGLTEEYGTNPNQPLFILDGFESTLSVISDFSMDRIESITVLKDASATAIYGSKAANGVIVIETKRPAAGQLRINYNLNSSFNFADLTDYNLMNAAEKLEFERLSGYYGLVDANGNITSDEGEAKYTARLKEVKRGVDTYWANEPLRAAFTQMHTLFAEGGDNNLRYSASLSYGKNDGVMKGSSRDATNGNVRLIYRKGRFSFNNSLSVDYINANQESIPYSSFVRANPYHRKYNAQGGIDKVIESFTYLDVSSFSLKTQNIYNPLYDMKNNNVNQSESQGFTNNFEMDWRVVDELRFRTRVGITRTTQKSEKFRSPFNSEFEGVDELHRGTYEESNQHQTNYDADVSLTYGKLLGGKHMVNAVGGFRLSQASSEMSGYQVDGFIDDDFSNPSFAFGYPENGQPDYQEAKRRAASFYLNTGYSYNDRYLLDATFRTDGSSVFGSERQFTSIWSTGLGWNMHNESFIKDRDIHWLNLLKIRGSIGNPGNQNFSDYISMRVYRYNIENRNPFGSSIILSNFGNNRLKWQKTLDRNIGLDLAVFDKRLKATFDYFNKSTDPLLVFVTQPSSTGTTTSAQNLGGQITKGFTVTADYAILQKKALNWRVNLNMRQLKAKYKNIGHSLDNFNTENKSRNLERYYDGGSPSDLWAVRSLGIDPATGREIYLNKNNQQTFVHNYDDEVVVGNSDPDLEGIIGTSFYYKGFSASINLRYRTGGQVFMQTLFDKVENISITNVTLNQDKRALYDRWKKPGDIAKFRAISQSDVTPISSRFVEDNNILSGESISFGYENTDAAWLRSVRASSLTLRAYLNDIFRISTVKNERGIDYPFARSVSFSLGLRF
ncbi:TonB-linked outer membrane protein, SusC/RagA family [bacterium A37T11]|nr:TonB-linked outer membrane protein, SusC/RagA family [bacterium A37T11]